MSNGQDLVAATDAMNVEELLDLNNDLPPAKRQQDCTDVLLALQNLEWASSNVRKYIFGWLYTAFNQTPEKFFQEDEDVPDTLRPLAQWLRKFGISVSHMTIQRGVNVFEAYTYEEINQFHFLPAIVIEMAAELPRAIRNDVLGDIAEQLEHQGLTIDAAKKRVAEELEDLQDTTEVEEVQEEPEEEEEEEEAEIGKEIEDLFESSKDLLLRCRNIETAIKKGEVLGQSEAGKLGMLPSNLRNMADTLEKAVDRAR